MKRLSLSSSVLRCVFFRRDNARLGRFLALWIAAVEHDNPEYVPYPEDEDALNDAIRLGWVVLSRGTHYLTGPDRDKAWLRRRDAVCTYLVEANGQDLVKIGRSIDPRKRLGQLQTNTPHRLSLYAVLVGDHESALHQRFAALRVGGEWFRFDPEIKEVIAQLDQVEV